jgi:hypothetical protein
MVKRDDQPTLPAKNSGELTESRGHVLEIVERQRAEDSVNGTVRKGRGGQIGHQKPSTTCAPRVRLAHHAGAQVESDHLTALFGQPSRMSATGATGIEDP